MCFCALYVLVCLVLCDGVLYFLFCVGVCVCVLLCCLVLVFLFVPSLFGVWCFVIGFVRLRYFCVLCVSCFFECVFLVSCLCALFC